MRLATASGRRSQRLPAGAPNWATGFSRISTRSIREPAHPVGNSSRSCPPQRSSVIANRFLRRIQPAADPSPREADFVIVGAGSAGCVLANRLSASGRHRVVLIEAGPRDRHLWIHIPLGYGKLFKDARVNWLYRSEPEPELNGRVIFQPRGKVLGGSSSINGLVYIRGQPEDFDQWRQLGNAGWGFDDVLPYFRRSRGPGARRGRAARRRRPAVRLGRDRAARAVRRLHRGGASRRAFRATTISTVRSRRAPAISRRPRGAASAGARPRAISGRRSAGRTFGSSPRRSRRASSSTAARPSAWSTAAAARRSRCGRGARSILAGGRHQLAAAPAALRASARRRCCGSTASRSSPKAPASGEDFQDHLQVRMVLQVHAADHHQRRDQLADAPARSRHALRALAQGPAHRQRGLCRRVLPHATSASPTPDMQVHFITFSTDRMGERLHPFPGFTASVCQLRPESRGFVRIKSPDPAAPPAIQPRYLSTETDRRTNVEGLKRLRAIMRQPAMRPYVLAEHLPGEAVQSDDEFLSLRARGRQHDLPPELLLPHGHRSDRAVVDPRLQGARRREPARRRRRDHAERGLRQHQRSDRHDRREGLRHDPRGCAMNLFDLTGKVALVTGGNGGIGLGMAKGLVQAGAAVVWPLATPKKACG